MVLIVQVKFQGAAGHLDGPKHYLPTEKTPLVLPFLLTALTLPLLLTLDDSTLKLFLTASVSTFVRVETLLRLYHLLRTLLDSLSSGDVVITRSPGMGAEAGGKSDNRDIPGAGGGLTDIALPDS